MQQKYNCRAIITSNMSRPRRPKSPSHPGPLTVPAMCRRWPCLQSSGFLQLLKFAWWQSPPLSQLSLNVITSVKSLSPLARDSHVFPFAGTVPHTVPVPHIKLTVLNFFIPIHSLHSPMSSSYTQAGGSSIVFPPVSGALPWVEWMRRDAFCVNETNEWSLEIEQWLQNFPYGWTWGGDTLGLVLEPYWAFLSCILVCNRSKTLQSLLRVHLFILPIR